MSYERFNHYQKLRRENPFLYFSTKIQQEMKQACDRQPMQYFYALPESNQNHDNRYTK